MHKGAANDINISFPSQSVILNEIESFHSKNIIPFNANQSWYPSWVGDAIHPRIADETVAPYSAFLNSFNSFKDLLLLGFIHRRISKANIGTIG